jgi:hypothetical protein
MSSRSSLWLVGPVLLVAAVVSGCGNSPVTPQPPAGTVTVFSHEGDTAVPGVHVEVLDTQFAGDTGADGKIQFVLSPGRYIVRVFTNGLPLPPYLDNQVVVADHDALLVDADLCWSCR